MTKSFNRWVMGSLAVSLFALTLSIAADDNSPGSAWKTDLLTWRAQQAKDLQEPNGWLTLIGLEWLKPGDNSFGSAKGNTLVVQAPTDPNLGIVHLIGDALQLLPPPGGYPKGLQVAQSRLPSFIAESATHFASRIRGRRHVSSFMVCGGSHPMKLTGFMPNGFPTTRRITCPSQPYLEPR